VTLDRPAAGVVVAQPDRGFRYTSDAMWLARFALETGPMPRTALDLGTGSGVVAMLLASRGIDVVAIDADPSWEPLWSETLARSDVRGKVTFAIGRAEDEDDERYDLVVANPPYAAPGTGPLPPDPRRAVAMVEEEGGLSAFVRRATRAAIDRACFVLPRAREEELVRLGAEHGRGVRTVERVGRRRSLVCFG
jgi:tRNA1(Val) A37 N6-methylase TrmN6